MSDGNSGQSHCQYRLFWILLAGWEIGLMMYWGPLSASLGVPSGFRRRFTANMGLRSEGENEVSAMYCSAPALYSFPAVLLFCKVCSLYMQANKGNSLSLAIPIFGGSNVVYMKGSFPDCMSCQMEDSCREEASNVSQGTK